MIRTITIAVVLALGTNVVLAAQKADMPKATGGAASTKASSEVRDWKAIDINHDGYIEPTEMQAYLKSEWAKAKTGR